MKDDKVNQLEQAERWLKEAYQLVEKFEYVNAISLFNKAATAFERQGKEEQYLECLTKKGWYLLRVGKLDEAVDTLQTNINICCQYLGENHDYYIDNHNNLGMYYSHVCNYEKSLEYFHKAQKLVIAKYEGKKHPQIAANYNNLAQVYITKGDYSMAEEYLYKALKILKYLYGEFHGKIAIVYDGLGLLKRNMGDINSSVEFHRKALKIDLALTGEKNPNIIGTYSNLANALSDKGDYQQALFCHKKSLTISLELFDENHFNLSHYYNNIGYTYTELGDYDKALYYHEQSLYLKEKIFGKDNHDLGISLFNVGGVLAAKKKYSQAISMYKKAIEIYLKSVGENHIDTVFMINDLGYVYNLIGDYEKGLYNFKKALRIRKKILEENHPHIAISYTNIGDVHFFEKRYNEAIQNYQKALHIRLKSLGKKHFKTIETNQALGKCFLAKNNFQIAEMYFQESLQKLLPNFENKSIYRLPKVSRIYSNNYVFLEVLMAKVALFQKLSESKKEGVVDLLAGILHIQSALKLIEVIRQSYQTEGNKLLLAQNNTRVLEKGIDISYKASIYANKWVTKWQKNIASIAKINYDTYATSSNLYPRTSLECLNIAFKFSEASKSLLLLSRIQDSNAKLQAAIPKELQQKEYDLKVELNYLDQQIKIEKSKGGQKDESLLQKWKSQHFNYYQKYEQLILQFEKGYPEYYRLKYDVQTIDIKNVQQGLCKKQLMISYFIGEKYLYIFGITRDGFEVIQQEKTSNFNQLIKSFNKALNRLIFQKYAQAAHELYKILLAPIFQHPSFKKTTPSQQYSKETIQQSNTKNFQQLIIIPHDILSTLPFEALLCSLSEKKTPLQYADLDYLLLHYDVVYHYSATLWRQAQKDIKKNGLEDSFVGFAPVYQEDEPQKEAKELSTTHLEPPNHQKESGGLRSVKIGEKSYHALLYSEEEVKGIQAAFETKQLPQSIFLHEQATKANFKQAVKGKKYVLIAAHGFYNKNQPELSGIIFSPENVEKSEEAVLYVSDAYHLDLQQTDLVVLSACESGIGKLAKGEGMMAVNRGFLYSGAKNVIFTLFKVYDEQSSELTQALFRCILEGKTYSQALRLAKLELVRSGEVDPKAWAGFVMIGGGS